jgi:PhnB protein
MPQRFVPMLSYENGIAAIDWLQTVFQFEVAAMMVDDDGRLSHAELSIGDQRIMLASSSPDYRNPKHMRDEYEAASKWLQLPYIFNGTLVYVDDLDSTFERAEEAGAEILSPIEDGFPGRRFRMADLEGQRWFVFQNIA